MGLTILSLNINCSTPWAKKSAALKQLVEETRPDIVCLQEVAQNFATDRPDNHQEHHIRELLGAQSSFSVITHPYMPGGDRALEDCMHGPAIFVLNPLIKNVKFTDILIYEGSDRTYHNAAAQFSVDGKPVTLVDVHLSAEARHTEVAKTLDWLRENSRADDAAIVCGDFNPHDALNPSKSDVDDVMREAFADTWQQLRHGEKLETYFSLKWWQTHYPNSDVAVAMAKKGKTHPTSALDFFFHKNITAVSIDSAASFMPSLSDHAALIAKFRI